MGRKRSSAGASLIEDGLAKSPRSVRPRAAELPITNRDIAELLALEGEKSEGYRRKAFFGAAHAAFRWPAEAAAILAEGRSLTELSGIGPFLAKAVASWIENPPEKTPVPPSVRRNFLTMSQAAAILEDHPDWRDRLNGDLQMHTEWSDGSGTIRDMAEAGMGRRYEYIGITDHTKGLKIAGGIDETELKRQADEIRALNQELLESGKNFQVLRSVELNLSPSGGVDLDCGFLNGLDLVLGSFHSKLRVTEDQTDRYLAALEHPCLHILGHPRGRIYNYREGLKADWRRVFARAAELDKAVEVDAYTDRQDIDVELLQIAREEGVRISFGSDSHHPWQLIFLDLALAATILAGIPADRIINFMSREQLLSWVRSIREQAGAH